MEQIVIYLLMVQRLLNLKQILAYSLCLGNISKDWTNDNMKKTGFNGYIYDFITDYNAIDTHKCLMKKNGIV